MNWVFLTKYALAQNGWDRDFYGVLMWYENYVWCDLKLVFVTIPMYFFTIEKILQCCDKLWFLGVSIVTRRDLQRSIVIYLNLAIYCESWWYTLRMYLRLDSIQTIKKRPFSEAHIFHNSENYKNRYTCCALAGGTYFCCLRKVPPAPPRSACVLQELGW